MKILNIVFFLAFGLLAISCTTEKVLFEKGDWWIGHWQQLSDETQFFSSGQKSVAGIVTSQFFYSTADTIYDNFHLELLEDFNHKRRWKVIKTNKDSYIKILEINDSSIEVFGPSPTVDGLDQKIVEYKRMPEQIEPPFPDSILFGE